MICYDDMICYGAMVCYDDNINIFHNEMYDMYNNEKLLMHNP